VQLMPIVLLRKCDRGATRVRVASRSCCSREPVFISKLNEADNFELTRPPGN
jgi:hypothetical protein